MTFMNAASINLDPLCYDLKIAHRSRSERADGKCYRANDIYLLLQLGFPLTAHMPLG